MNELFSNNTNPEIFSLSAIVVALIIQRDYTSDELNSIGNWLELVGQICLTTGAQQQLINNHLQNNSGSKIRSDANTHALNNQPLAHSQDIETLSRKIEEIEKKIQ